MPNLRIDKDIPELEFCTLRQALDWVAFDFKPVPEEYEDLLRAGLPEDYNNCQDAKVVKAKAEIIFALNILVIACNKTFFDIEGVNWNDNILVADGEGHSNVEISVESLYKNFPSTKDINRNSKLTKSGYTTYYLELMIEAINDLEITEENQPLIKNLKEWFEDKGENLSKREIGCLSTFCRKTIAKKGGNLKTGAKTKNLTKK